MAEHVQANQMVVRSLASKSDDKSDYFSPRELAKQTLEGRPAGTKHKAVKVRLAANEEQVISVLHTSTDGNGTNIGTETTSANKLERNGATDKLVHKDPQTINYWHYKQTGIKSQPIKPIKHPIEHIGRKIIVTYLVGLTFKLIAILSGPLIVLLFHLISLPVLLGRRSIWALLNLLCNAKIMTEHIDSLYEPTSRQQTNFEWKYCPLNFLETFWFQDRLVNTVVLVLKETNCKEWPAEDDKLRLSKLRSLFASNVLSKPSYRKFLSRVIERGLPLCKALYWQYLGFPKIELEQQQEDESASYCEQRSDPSVTSSTCSSLNRRLTNVSVDEICIDINASSSSRDEQSQLVDEKRVDIRHHIYIDQTIVDSKGLVNLNSVRRHAHSLLESPLDGSRPLWELRVIPAAKEAKTYLIFRCHQSLADGRNLVELLTDNLTANHAPSESATTKSRGNQSNNESSSSELAKRPNADLDKQTGDSNEFCHQKQQDHDEEEVGDDDDEQLKATRVKRSFVARISRSSGFQSALFVGPLTVLLWIIWAFAKRKNNHLNRCSASEQHQQRLQDKQTNRPRGFSSTRFAMAKYSLTKFYQIKQMTRSTMNDIVLCAFSGALRNYLTRYNAIPNPPNLHISLAVDMRQPSSAERKESPSKWLRDSISSLTDGELDQSSPTNPAANVERSLAGSLNVYTTVVNVSLPTSIEGAVPRLWDLRSTMEELRASADCWVMLGLQRFLHLLLPASVYRFLVDKATLRNSSALVSNIRGPNNMVESWCVDLAERALYESQQPPRIFKLSDCDKPLDHLIKTSTASKRVKRKTGRLKLQGNLGWLSSVYYCMQAPSVNMPISFNCITYHDKIFITALSRSVLVEDSNLLLGLFLSQLNQLASTIAKRRSLITYVKSVPLASEVAGCCVPPSPKGPIEFARVMPLKRSLSDEDNARSTLPSSSSPSGVEQATQSRQLLRTNAQTRRGSVGTIESLSSSGLMPFNRCQSCDGKLCLCKRRKSLFAIESSRQRPSHILGLFNPGQMMFLHKTDKGQKRETHNDGDHKCERGHFL